jgi:Zn-dependent protease with chaperone function
MTPDELPAILHDGRTSRPEPVTLRFCADGTLTVAGATETRSYPRDQVQVESRLGNAPRFVRLPDDSRCEVADNDTLDTILANWSPQHAATWLHRLERSWRWALPALVLLLAAGWAAIRFGLPWAARHVAFAMPAGVTTALGDHTLAALDRTVFSATHLTAERQAELQGRFREFLRATGDDTAYRIEFRAGGRIGANAFALPSGTIVITDELVGLARDDREIYGVLAHECGHVRQRHILRSVLQNSAVFVMLALVTGDVSSATAFGGALPSYLLKSKFSREFEAEADAHAAGMLRAAGLSPSLLADMLEHLAAAHHADGEEGMLDYLGSHPSTPERARALRQ